MADIVEAISEVMRVVKDKDKARDKFKGIYEVFTFNRIMILNILQELLGNG